MLKNSRTFYLVSLLLASTHVEASSFLIWWQGPAVDLSSPLFSEQGISETKRMSTSWGQMSVVDMPEVLSKQGMQNILSQLPVKMSEPLGTYKISSEQIFDPMFALQWSLENTGQRVPDNAQNPSGPQGVAGVDINAKAAWDLSLGDPQVVVAILDTGINFAHPELKDSLWVNTGEIPGNKIDDDHNGYVDDVHGANILSPSRQPLDDHGHGSHISGTIVAAHDGIGVMGIAPLCKVMAIKAFNSEGSGSTADIIQGLDYAYKMKAKLINASFGGYEYSAITKKILQQLALENIM